MLEYVYMKTNQARMPRNLLDPKLERSFRQQRRSGDDDIHHPYHEIFNKLEEKALQPLNGAGG